MFKEILASDKRSLNPYTYEDRLNVLSTYNLNDMRNYQSKQSPTTHMHQYDDQNDKR